MWSRRRFLEAASGLPLVGGLVGAVALNAAPVAAMAGTGLLPRARRPALHQRLRHLHRDDRVADAAGGDGRDQLRLQALRDARRASTKVGERIATLVHAEAAMVTSGAASALTLGTAAVLTGTDQQKMVALPDLTGMKSEVIIQKAHRFGYDHAVRNCGVRTGGSRDARRSRTRGQRQDRDDALLQQQQQGRPDPGRGVRPARKEARRFRR